MKRLRRSGPLALFLALHAVILSADLLAPHAPHIQDRQAALMAPSLGGDGDYLLGTDRFGRDVFSRLLFGARTSLLAGLMAATLAVTLGVALGLVAGWLGGLADSAVMGTAELVLSLPWLYLLLAIRALLPLDAPPEATFLLIASLIGLLAWARPARLVRGIALESARADSVLAARGFGAGPLHLVLHHVLPRAWPTALTQWTLLVPACIVGEVTLSFLGLGVPEPRPSLGTLLAAGQNVSLVSGHPWLLAPVIALAALVLSYHQMSQALQAWDPSRVVA